MAPEAPDGVATIGRIVRPQGNRGEVVILLDTDHPEERFAPGTTLVLRHEGADRAVTIRESRPHGERWVVGFEGVNTISDAEALKGGELIVRIEELAPLEPGQFYMHDLVGCAVVTVEGAPVGTVTRVDSLGTPLLAVATSRGEALVPFADAICRTVDVNGKTIVIDPPEGLLTL
jgi:16S rRNA processing protein RimM